MIANPYDHYKRVQVETASQGRLILMLYAGALKNLRNAQNYIQQKDVSGAHRMLMKTQDIIKELNITLNMNAGEISNNLRNLYLYMLQRLVEANVNKDAEKIEEVIELLTTLKEAWDAVILKNKPVTAP
ncbi:flagellar protein FliS [Pelosinus fermentans]|uniref:flagellar export chaperone FliS n=1 Tax=Pelosinus fermentans TaxID=365349 RepID=UPI0002685EA8|nr:flagellar export chaperone FliS [Pelosinus fermentans]OAM92851.1 flagellar protein FliS [Pelosinus fermentans DSM 17108]SDQ58895.1 flagellar protein FliS [Pelosinus fermentans]